MSRLAITAFTITALLGGVVLTETAEAGRTRSPIERRLRPGKGFWANSSTTRSGARCSGIRYQTPWSGSRYVMRPQVPRSTWGRPTGTLVQSSKNVQGSKRVVASSDSRAQMKSQRDGQRRTVKETAPPPPSAGLSTKENAVVASTPTSSEASTTTTELQDNRSGKTQ